MKTSITLSKLILLVLFLVPNAITAQNHIINVKGTQIQVSSNLQTVLEQAETVYGIPTNITFNDVYNKAPTAIPFFLGLIMQRQEIIMKEIRNVEHLNNSNVLEDEIMAFLTQLAEAHNYMDPINNTSMIAAKLQVFYYEALQGNQNDNSKNKFGIDPTTVNIAYILDQTPSTDTTNLDPNAKIQVTETPTEINLFGEVSGAAVSTNTNSDKEYADALAGPEKPQKKPVEKGVILGRWTGFYFYYGSELDTGEPRLNQYVTFSKGSGRALKHGKEIYRGKENNGTQYYIISEKQVDQYTMAYEAYVDYPETLTKKGEYSWMYWECDGNKFTFEVESTLIRNKGSKEYRTGFRLWLNDCTKFNPAHHLIK